MRLSPIEIRRHQFATRFRGLDADEVYAYLQTVVADFEEVVRENASLRREAERLAREVEGFSRRERALQDTLTTAQGVADQLTRTAVKESEVIVSEAEIRAEKLLRDSEIRRAEIAREISDLRKLRIRAELDLRHTLEGYLQLIDAPGRCDATRGLEVADADSPEAGE
ncbi:MAG: DivIVA domain-containing protein [Myxococcota bacterium]